MPPFIPRGPQSVSITPQITQAVPGARIQGVAPGIGNFVATGITLPANTSSPSFAVTADAALTASKTQLFNPETVSWEVSQTAAACGTGCASAGKSVNPIFVTLVVPQLQAWQGPLQLSYVSLAVADGGATTPQGAFANTWGKFSPSGIGPANVTAWDGRVLTYYPSNVGFQGCATNASALVEGNGSGQCRSFQELLATALQVNGVASTLVKTIAKTLNEDFMVKTWSTAVAPGYVYAGYPWVLKTYGDWSQPANTFQGMVPAGASFGDMANGAGSAGQNSPTPSEKVFGSHYFISVTSSIAPAGKGPYFDPSYGLWYSNQTDFESKAVAYYTKPEQTFVSPPPANTPLYTQWGVRTPSGATNMCFATAVVQGSYGACN